LIWQRIDAGISFHDPESGFEFRTVSAILELAFRDWQNRLIRFELASVTHFRFSYVCELADFPGPGFYTIEDSPLIERLREPGAVGPNEPVNHYVIATNEDQCCDAVAESYRIVAE
jgi:hypothetical protein